MLSASDFIHMLQRLRSVVSSSANPMSEQEMDLHTIRCAPHPLPAGGAACWAALACWRLAGCRSVVAGVGTAKRQLPQVEGAGTSRSAAC